MKLYMFVMMAGVLGCASEPVGSTQQDLVAPLRLVATSELCTTLGSVSNGSVTDAKMRAVFPASTAQSVELQFNYNGPTVETEALLSGEIRRQLGLKLRAQDGCNLVYVMWRIDPKPALIISVKKNPGQKTSAECGNNGYTNIKPFNAYLPAPTGHHSLRADLKGQELVVLVDGNVAWTGDLGPDSLTFDGPTGMRSDNADFDFNFYGVGPLGCAVSCTTVQD